MKVLSKAEIIQMANELMMDIEFAQEVADLFISIYHEQGDLPGWKIKTNLNDVWDYISEWNSHWCRETGWEDYYNYEKECCYYDYDEPETVFQSVESFKKHIQKYDFAYELKYKNMIVIVY